MAPRLVGGKLVRSMNDYYTAYGWGTSYPSGINAGLKLSADGKVFGDGTYWGMALGGNLVGVFYNKSLLTQLGVGVPSSYEDLVADMGKAKAAGLLPLEVGNLDQTQAGHIASTLIDHFESVSKVNNWVNGKANSTIDTNGVAQGLQALNDWVKSGYISSQANGIKEDDGAADFAAGKSLFDITGSWRTSQFDTALGDNGGFMLLPGSKVNKAPATGWFSEAWTISAKTAHADVAAYFLDYLYGPDSQKANIIGGYLPFAPGATTPGKAIAKDVLSEWYKASGANGLTGYLDSATPSMGTTEFPALQSMIAGQETPANVLAAMQKDWADYHTGK
jgi:raffinose/stachyose/melibiose transport system substrate-binding protein